jgi:hypothetical protein
LLVFWHLRSCWAAEARPPAGGADPGEELGRAERSGDVVVRSGVQRVDLVARVRPADSTMIGMLDD